MTGTTIRITAIAMAVLALACGTPRAAIRATAMPEPTAAPAPTTAPPLSVVTHAEMGDAWPLIVEDGTIICSGASILLRTNRGLFAVNGTARGQHKWKDIRDITKPDPNIAGLLMDVQPIIDRGLLVCR